MSPGRPKYDASGGYHFAPLQLCGPPEECRSGGFNGLYHKAPVEKVVPLLATCLGNEHAAVAGGAVKWAVRISIIRIVMRADRVVRAQTGELHWPFRHIRAESAAKES
jgi:hypothetical protein